MATVESLLFSPESADHRTHFPPGTAFRRPVAVYLFIGRVVIVVGPIITSEPDPKMYDRLLSDCRDWPTLRGRILWGWAELRRELDGHELAIRPISGPAATDFLRKMDSLELERLFGSPVTVDSEEN